MIAWTADELTRIGRATEFQIASRRPDGSLRPFVTIWGARLGDDLYVRSAHGPENGWFRLAKTSGQGRVRAGGVERDVAFEVPGPDVDAPLHAAYHAKYDRYGPGPVGSVVSPEAARSTLRLVPR
jgi:hypothetical protein